MSNHSAYNDLTEVGEKILLAKLKFLIKEDKDALLAVSSIVRSAEMSGFFDKNKPTNPEPQEAIPY